MWLQAHVGFWQLGLVLFVIAVLFSFTKKGTVTKIFHMILRLDYIFILITGLYLVFHEYSVHGFWVIIKMLCGLVVISMMEMILIRRQKQKTTGMFWLLLIIFLALVFYIGYVVLN